ncbi:hypothetical protein PC9H_001968 [Pleurotus ostreatus]|uniref:t-SNARE coiled-coil homology domain-containing protein n=1 Tax=Pleurotus ostreatus TaxID=5322 RepID=A0A8H6ZHN6_PLEOS|nr:uncharacterized protein PC9H_001968 [Pleurotus ostreatus]KAF7419380.1 hypothetical protein PC9H_001968 [Pleurotus ostreatus]KAJ8689828.1 gamma tubulin complex Spc97/GCP2 subunit Alp4 [Pleurotus ostreatus]
MSLAKLTSTSTQTLSLLLERQRLQTFPAFSASSDAASDPLHLPQIRKNMGQLRAGILDMEAKEGRTQSAQLLRNQYGRMRAMLGNDAGLVEPLDNPEPSTSRAESELPLIPPPPPSKDTEPIYTPYTDDPQGDADPGIMLQTQRRLMDEQDEHLDRLSQSVGRQHHISLQINDELDVHTGLLQELDTDLDQTGNRLTSARRRLDRVARGAKENSSAMAIGLLILILLLLIIIFKT